MKGGNFLRLLSTLALLALALWAPALAASPQAQEAAQSLYELGLFRGVGVQSGGQADLALEESPDRQQGVAMLVRLLGQEQAALEGEHSHPFSDVQAWAAPYVAYAYETGLTNGVSQQAFGAREPMTQSQYLTFLLRALGYESGADFAWDRAAKLAQDVHLIDEPPRAEMSRGEAAWLSLRALNCRVKNRQQSLAAQLVESGAITESQAREQGLSLGRDRLEVTALDVGQGDSTLLQSGGETMLVDTGPGEAAQQLIRQLEDRGVQCIDSLLITHVHADHIGGMSAVLERFEVGKIYMPDQTTTTATYEKVLDTLAEKNYTVSSPPVGERLFLGSCRIDVLGPVQRYDDLNNASVVLRLRYGNQRLLLVGDMEQPAERDLLASGAIVFADVLKVGHHGSKTSTGEAFLQAVSPTVALISVGRDNAYHHPSVQVLLRLRGIGCRIYRTDQDGAIDLQADGTTWQTPASAA